MRYLKLAVLAASTLFFAQQAFACSCFSEATVEEQAADYDLIFVGTPIKSVSIAPPPVPRSFWDRVQFWKPAPPPPRVNPWAQMQMTQFQVQNMMKGPAGETVTIHHMLGDGANCGISFPDTDRKHFILASLSADGTYQTSACASPRFSEAEFEEAISGPSSPLPPSDEIDETQGIEQDANMLIGTWGRDAAQCAVSQERQGAPFVLTLETFDQHETHCSVNNIDKTAPSSWSLKLACDVEGDAQSHIMNIDIRDGKLWQSWNGDATYDELIACAEE